MKPPIRILLVDDHYVVRMGLAAILQMEPDMSLVAEADDAERALEEFRKHRPDVTLLDIRMPGVSGVEATRRIRAEFPEARVVMLTTSDGDETIFQAVKAGTSGYLLKNAPGDELIAAIRQVHAGERYLPRAVASRLAERNPDASLTPRELEVLELLTKGLTNREIGELLGFSTNTAKAHLKHILSKLEVSDRTEATRAAVQRGILDLN